MWIKVLLSVVLVGMVVLLVVLSVLALFPSKERFEISVGAMLRLLAGLGIALALLGMGMFFFGPFSAPSEAVKEEVPQAATEAAPECQVCPRVVTHLHPWGGLVSEMCHRGQRYLIVENGNGVAVVDAGECK